MTDSTITLRFVTAGDPVSRIIRGGEMGFWASHVECATPWGTLLGAHADGGVQDRAGDYDTTWTRQLLVDVPCTATQANDFLAFLKAQIGKPYDLEAIGEMAIGAVMGTPPDLPLASPAYICSGLQTAALISAGVIKQAPATPRLTTPRDLLQIVSVLAPIGTPETQTPDASAPAVLYTVHAAPLETSQPH